MSTLNGKKAIESEILQALRRMGQEAGLSWARERALPSQLGNLARHFGHYQARKGWQAFLKPRDGLAPHELLYMRLHEPMSLDATKPEAAAFWGESVTSIAKILPEDLTLAESFCRAALAYWAGKSFHWAARLYLEGFELGRECIKRLPAEGVQSLREYYDGSMDELEHRFDGKSPGSDPVWVVLQSVDDDEDEVLEDDEDEVPVVDSEEPTERQFEAFWAPIMGGPSFQRDVRLDSKDFVFGFIAGIVSSEDAYTTGLPGRARIEPRSS